MPEIPEEAIGFISKNIKIFNEMLIGDVYLPSLLMLWRTVKPIQSLHCPLEVLLHLSPPITAVPNSEPEFKRDEPGASHSHTALVQSCSASLQTYQGKHRERKAYGPSTTAQLF